MSGCLKIDKGIGVCVWGGGEQHKGLRGRGAGCVWRRDGGRLVRSGQDEEVGWVQLTKACIPGPKVWPSY